MSRVSATPTRFGRKNIFAERRNPSAFHQLQHLFGSLCPLGFGRFLARPHTGVRNAADINRLSLRNHARLLPQIASAFKLLLIAIALGTLTLSMMETKPTNNGLPLVHSSYAVSCQPLMPIQPIKPKMHPFGRKPDDA